MTKVSVGSPPAWETGCGKPECAVKPVRVGTVPDADAAILALDLGCECSPHVLRMALRIARRKLEGMSRDGHLLPERLALELLAWARQQEEERVREEILGGAWRE